METVDNLESIMGLIIHGGDAKSKAVEAIRSAKKGDFIQAQELLKQAQASLSIAHKSQTRLLVEEASGNANQVSLLMVHGQDHLMNAITFLDMAKETIELYQRLNELGDG